MLPVILRRNADSNFYEKIFCSHRILVLRLWRGSRAAETRADAFARAISFSFALDPNGACAGGAAWAT